MQRWFIGLSTMCFLVACEPSNETARSLKERDAALREMIREEIRGVLREDFALDRGQKEVHGQVQELILEEVRKQLAAKDWGPVLGSKEVMASLEKLQRQARSGGPGAMPEAVDLTGLSSHRAKIQRILQEFEGVTTYYSGSPLTKQLRDLGPGAKNDIFQALQSTSQQNWAARQALSEALEPLLTTADRELFLQDAASDNPALLKRAMGLNLEEVGALALHRISSATDDRFINSEVVSAALHFHQKEAAPLLLAQIAQGGSQSAWLAQHLRRELPNLPMRDTLMIAAQHYEKSPNVGQRHSVAPLLLAEGIPQGLVFAADSLMTTENNHWQEAARSAIRRYVNVVGSDEDVAAYLLENRHNLRWNPSTGTFQ